ncbi:hypothetical protein [Specibacter cremeus]|uniref:hypothetical protein n=1 Tax=Specibacter cremeus TaxID=1629051 RepID=UPI0013DE1008|nr:hypothetical protein [Specibacter cremeus]
MPHATFLPPDLGSFCRLDELGLCTLRAARRQRSAPHQVKRKMTHWAVKRVPKPSPK